MPKFENQILETIRNSSILKDLKENFMTNTECFRVNYLGFLLLLSLTFNKISKFDYILTNSKFNIRSSLSL